jgi:hypothetical protein
MQTDGPLNTSDQRLAELSAPRPVEPKKRRSRKLKPPIVITEQGPVTLETKEFLPVGSTGDGPVGAAADAPAMPAAEKPVTNPGSGGQTAAPGPNSSNDDLFCQDAPGVAEKVAERRAQIERDLVEKLNVANDGDGVQIPSGLKVGDVLEIRQRPGQPSTARIIHASDHALSVVRGLAQKYVKLKERANRRIELARKRLSEAMLRSNISAVSVPAINLVVSCSREGELTAKPLSERI